MDFKPQTEQFSCFHINAMTGFISTMKAEKTLEHFLNLMLTLTYLLLNDEVSPDLLFHNLQL